MAHKVPHDSHLAPIIYHLNYMIFSVRFRAEKEGGEGRVSVRLVEVCMMAERTFNILIKLHTTHMILMNKSSNNGRLL